ncbi:hypothetical protein M378DRAFT_167916, partial [Amanita muscaria Koide BX008]
MFVSTTSVSLHFLESTQHRNLQPSVAAQVSELNLIRQALYDLESAHNKIRQQYDEEIARLRADVAQQAQVAAVQQQQQQQQHVHPSQSQASLPPPPPPPPPPPSSSQPGSGTQVPPHHQVQVSQTGPPPPPPPSAVGRQVPGASSLVTIAGLPLPSSVLSVPPVSVPPPAVGPASGAGSYGAESYYAASTARGNRDRGDRNDRDGRDRCGMADQRESKRHNQRESKLIEESCQLMSPRKNVSGSENLWRENESVRWRSLLEIVVIVIEETASVIETEISIVDGSGRIGRGRENERG